jgi:hypothetical protein
VESSCEHGNETSPSTKREEFLTTWATISFSRRALLHSQEQCICKFLGARNLHSIKRICSTLPVTVRQVSLPSHHGKAACRHLFSPLHISYVVTQAVACRHLFSPLHILYVISGVQTSLQPAAYFVRSQWSTDISSARCIFHISYIVTQAVA